MQRDGVVRAAWLCDGSEHPRLPGCQLRPHELQQGADDPPNRDSVSLESRELNQSAWITVGPAMSDIFQATLGVTRVERSRGQRECPALVQDERTKGTRID